jgi:predicted dehydrogenase
LFPKRSFDPKLVVCADTEASRRERAVRDFGFERAVENWQDAISSPDVDAVWVTAPNMLHVPMIEAATAADTTTFGRH